MLQNFFILCSGSDSSILKTCSEGEQNKYAGIGATVFFTALIFNLDRFIVSTIKKRESFGNEFLQATPRIVLAVIIAIVISKPLEMKIFEKEINQVLLEEKNEMTLANKEQLALQYSPSVDKLNQDIAALKNEITTKEEETNALYDTYITEAEGTAGTMLLGKGPVYAEKREKHDAALAELKQLKEVNAAKIIGIETQIAALNTEYADVVKNSQPIIDGFDGLMARINALEKLPWLPSFFIFLLFLAIETSPIIAKLLAPKGEYDVKLEDEESTIKTWVKQKVQQREQVLATDTSLNEKIYTEIKEEEAVYAYKKQKAEELLKLQADAFHDLQIKSL